MIKGSFYANQLKKYGLLHTATDSFSIKYRYKLGWSIEHIESLENNF